MNPREDIYPKTNCLALTIRKEHKLIIINKIAKKTINISLKTILYSTFLTILSIFI